MKIFNTLFLIVLSLTLYGQCGTNGLPDYSFDPTDPDVDSKQFAVEFIDIPPPEMNTLDYYVAATSGGSVVGCGPVGANASGVFGNGQVFFNCDATIPEAISCSGMGCTDCQNFQVYYYDVSLDMFYPITEGNSTVVREYAFVDADENAIIDGFGATDVSAGTTESTVNVSLGNSDFNSFFTVFPVSFAVFTGAQMEKSVELNWTTASEISNEFFTVERSTTGENFNEIGEVAGAGYSRVAIDYDFTDDSPTEGTNFYRIRQNDTDGSISYSSILLIDFQGAAAGTMTVSPNPATNFLSVRLTENWAAESVSGMLLEASGRSVKEWQQRPGTSNSIDLAGIPAGIYQLMMANGKNRRIQRIVVR